ncbi:hypothetical protein, partial [Shewanella algae]|uniref:hypothetical protein n=1 Tax=Shewanella algae TaxID=38313 RepID=UPI00313E2882
ARKIVREKREQLLGLDTRLLAGPARLLREPFSSVCTLRADIGKNRSQYCQDCKSSADGGNLSRSQQGSPVRPGAFALLGEL